MAPYQFLCGAVVLMLLSDNGLATMHHSQCGYMMDGHAHWHWPWTAIITTDEHHVSCLGSLIDHYWVLTASHCRPKPGYHAYVHLGPMVGSDPHSCTKTIPVAHVICHEPHDTCKTREGICLMKLSYHVDYTNNIFPACLASPDSVFHSGMNAWVPTSPYPGSMVEVPIVGHDRCKCYHCGLNMYEMCAGHPEEHMEMEHGCMDGSFCEMFCPLPSPYAISKTVINSSPQDVGAPLIINYHGTYTQVGVTGYDDDCPSAQSLRVYSSVPAYYHWIANVTWMNNHSPVSCHPSGEDPDHHFVCPTGHHPKYDKCHRGHESVFDGGVNWMYPTPFILLCASVLSFFASY